VDAGEVCAVVLAAGAGSRFGGAKLGATIGGRPILQHVLDTLDPIGLAEIVVVLGADAAALEPAIDWGAARRVVNPDPGRGLSSSLRVGVDAVPPDAAGVLVVLGDQPRLSATVVRTLLEAGVDDTRPIAAPRYADDGGRNPVLLGRAARPLVAEVAGDRGLGPWLGAHPELVREVPIAGVPANPDVDTRADLVALLEAAWAEQVRANADQVDRHREVPDGADFYAPVTGLFRADPARTDDPALDALLELVEPGDTWLDIGAGAGRYALPIARALASSGGSVIAVDASRGMLDGLETIAAEHAITNVRVVHDRWPPTGLAPFAADVALIAHVGYDIAAIGPFLDAMEACGRRRCVAMLMERQPASLADPLWPPVHGEARVGLPALPAFVELLEARGRRPAVRRLDQERRRFRSREEVEGFARRQLWVTPGSAADRRFQAALDALLETAPDGSVALRDQPPLEIGVVTWAPRAGGATTG
jgi:CTP:molybdopterin cytidylyltransferase MocA/SAM-dependent methyltransferase